MPVGFSCSLTKSIADKNSLKLNIKISFRRIENNEKFKNSTIMRVSEIEEEFDSPCKSAPGSQASGTVGIPLASKALPNFN